MSGVVDLHIHTTFSDGLRTPTEIVSMALDRRLKYIAVSDHDTVEGVGEAIGAAQDTPLCVIPGTELSTSLGAQELHVLGYLIDHTSPQLLAALTRLGVSRERRAKAILERLRGLDIHLSWERVLELSGNGTIGRPHIARALEEAAYVATSQEAFERYLAPDKPAYVPRAKLTPSAAIQLISEAGGIAVLAHPWEQIDFVPELVAEGLGGLEVYYPGYSAEMTDRLGTLAKRYDLICTGGSDFHGLCLLPENRLGSPAAPESCVWPLLERREQLKRETMA